MTMRPLLMPFLAFLLIAVTFAEDSPLKSVLEVDPSQASKLAAPKKVVIAWSEADHPPNTHGYELFANTFGGLLSKVEGLEVRTVEGFPLAADWENADLVIFYLTIKELDDAQYAQLDAHLARGKGLMVLHQAIVQRKRTKDWGDRIGYSFSWDSEERSKWGGFSAPVLFDVSHPIFAGFPKSVPYEDELYWRLEKSARGVVTDLATTTAPANKEESEGQWPVYWTVEHDPVGTAQQARVFGCVIGHYDKYLEEQIFMTSLCRATAWCLYETFEPFKAPLRLLEQGR